MTALRLVGRGFGGVILLLCHAWATLALHHGPFDAAWLRNGLAGAYVLVVLVLMTKVRRRFLVTIVPFAVVVGWWNTIEPVAAGRNYPPETSRMPWAAFDGDTAKVHDIRNFRYRSETDFDVRYEDRTYNLDQVRSVDLFVSYWDGNTDIAHTFLSFGFADGRQLCVSVEIRREIKETYDTLKGIFKQYEIIYVWGDERDIVQLRTNHRKEDVYLYRTTCTPAESRLLLTSMLEESTRLKDDPAFYNTVTRNCTSSIVLHVNEVLPRKMQWWKRRLLNGLGDRRAYDHGWLSGDLPFEELKRRARIGERARSKADDADFPKRIRAGG